jgi:hypothetical protein
MNADFDNSKKANLYDKILILFFLLLSLAAFLLALEKFKRFWISDFLIWATLILISIAVYIFPMWIFFRNAKLHGFLKYLFSITIVPLFLSLLGANVVISYKFFPRLFDWYDKLGPPHLFRSPEDFLFLPLVFLISCSISIPLCIGWYLLLRTVDNRLQKRGEGKITNPILLD